KAVIYRLSSSRPYCVCGSFHESLMENGRAQQVHRFPQKSPRLILPRAARAGPTTMLSDNAKGKRTSGFSLTLLVRAINLKSESEEARISVSRWWSNSFLTKECAHVIPILV